VGWTGQWWDPLEVGVTLSRGGATYATYKLEHFKSELFGFTGDLFYTSCTFKSPYLWEPNMPLNLSSQTVYFQVST
jgi:hypothetical protein